MIGLIDIDSKIQNLALMKLSSYYKGMGEEVEFYQSGHKYDKIFASAVFAKSNVVCLKLKQQFGDLIEIGGTGYSLEKNLDDIIERQKPDYDLYTAEMLYKNIRGISTKEKRMKKAETLVNAGIGFTSRGCIRNCGFCVVPKKEGCFKQVAEIKDLLNPRSNVLVLNDNNLTADPDCIEKLHEIRDRKLVVDINQGCDVRLINDDIAYALSEVKHLRSIHYAWDLMGFEDQVMDGIKTLLKYMKAWRHMCFMLVGFNTTFEEDMYRYRKLEEMKISPYVMVYNDKPDIRLKHFERWVNSRSCKACAWDDYKPWVRDRLLMGDQVEMRFLKEKELNSCSSS